MTESLESYWESWVSVARTRDARRAEVSSAIEPPILAELMEASRRTALCRLFPFIGHSALCFSTAAWRGGAIAPAYVVLSREHGYVVYEGDPYEGATMVRDTHSAAAAAAELERLLAGWREDKR